jgi:hypothetical protein
VRLLARAFSPTDKLHRYPQLFDFLSEPGALSPAKGDFDGAHSCECN